MKIIETPIEGVYVIEPKVFEDARGYFFESFSQKVFDEELALPYLGRKVEFVQDNESMSSFGVMRGLHFQRPPHSQAKLVRCVRGRVFDVAVDLRVGSPSYGQWYGVELSEQNRRQLFLDKGFAHGFAVLSQTAVFQYKCDDYYHPECDAGISIMDKSLGIEWPVDIEQAILSPKDTRQPLFKDFVSPFI